VAGYQVSFFVAVANTGVAVGTVVAIATAPVFTGFLAALTGRSRLTGRWVLSTLVAVCGCVVIVLGGAHAGVHPVGVVLAGLAGLSYAIYAVVAASLIGDGAPSNVVMAVLFAGAGIVLVPVLVASHPGWLLTARGDVVTAHLAVLATAAAYLLYGYGLRVTAVTVAATLSLAEPGAAAVLGIVLLREPVRATTVAGLMLLAVALGILTLRAVPHARVPPDAVRNDAGDDRAKTG
jgi:DME family drug/metabolite transporter